MTHIILTAEQSRIVRAANAVEVRDEEGRTIGHLTPLTPADLESIERSREVRARGEPCIPSADVQAHLKRLEEIRQNEELDEDKMLDLLQRMQAGEKV